jgi:hypothetical protein
MADIQMRRSLTTLFLCCLLTQHVVGQQTLPPPQTPARPNPAPVVNEPKTVDNQDVVKITTNLVQIDAVVTDKSGKRVVDLKPDEVEIKPAGSMLQSFLHVKASDLTFSSEPDGSRKATFEIAAVTFSDNGKIIDQFVYPRSITVAAVDYERVNKNGFVYRLTIPIKKAGAYQLRMAVRDAVSKRIGAAAQFIEIPDLSKNRLSVSGILLSGIPLESYRKNFSVQPAGEKSDGANLQADQNANPAVRLFKTDHVLVYAFNIYKSSPINISSRKKTRNC